MLIVHREGVLCILLIVKLAPQADTRSNVSLGSADMPRNPKIAKHTGETNHLNSISTMLSSSGRRHVARVNYFQMFVLA